MLRFRKMTWAILAWTALFAIEIVLLSEAASRYCDGLTGKELATCQATAAIGGGIGIMGFILFWFLGFIVLAIIRHATRPKGRVFVYGPQGQQVMLPESEARKRVSKPGWSYQSPASTGPQPGP